MATQEQVNIEVGKLYAQMADYISRKVQGSDTFSGLSGNQHAELELLAKELSSDIANIQVGTQLQKAKALNTINIELAEYIVSTPNSPYIDKMSASQLNQLALQSVVGGAEDYVTFGHEINDLIAHLAIQQNLSIELFESLLACYSILDGDIAGFMSEARTNGSSLSDLLSVQQLTEISDSTESLGSLNPILSEKIASVVELSKPYYNIDFNLLKNAGYDLRENAALLIPFIPAAVQYAGWTTALLYAGNAVVDDAINRNTDRGFKGEKAVDELEARFCKVYSNALETFYQSLHKICTEAITNPRVNKLSVLKTLNRLKSTDDYKNLELLESREYEDPRGAWLFGHDGSVIKFNYGENCPQGKLSQAGYALFALKEIPSNDDLLTKSPDEIKSILSTIASMCGVKAEVYKKAEEAAEKAQEESYEKAGLADAARRRRAVTHLIEWASYGAVGVGVIWGLSKVYKSYKSED